eukprot:446740-Pleurochrysis_carterae.AAC.2
MLPRLVWCAEQQAAPPAPSYRTTEAQGRAGRTARPAAGEPRLSLHLVVLSENGSGVWEPQRQPIWPRAANTIHKRDQSASTAELELRRLRQAMSAGADASHLRESGSSL